MLKQVEEEQEPSILEERSLCLREDLMEEMGAEEDISSYRAMHSSQRYYIFGTESMWQQHQANLVKEAAEQVSLAETLSSKCL